MPDFCLSLPLSQSQFYPDMSMRRPASFYSLPFGISFCFLEQGWWWLQSWIGMKSQSRELQGAPDGCPLSVHTDGAKTGKGPWLQTDALSHAKPSKWHCHGPPPPPHTHTLFMGNCALLSQKGCVVSIKLIKISATCLGRKGKPTQDWITLHPWGSIYSKQTAMMHQSFC